MLNKKEIITILISGFLLISFKPAFASEDEYSAAMKSLDTDFSKADFEMNRIYQQVLKEYAADKEFTSKFVKSQIAWAKYRDAYLESMYPKKDKQLNYGSVYLTCYALNMSSLTKERTKQIKQWLIGLKEGDVCSGSIKIKH